MDFRFDAIVSADAFENLKPAPDIFLAASKTLGVDTSEVNYIANIMDSGVLRYDHPSTALEVTPRLCCCCSVLGCLSAGILASNL